MRPRSQKGHRSCKCTETDEGRGGGLERWENVSICSWGLRKAEDFSLEKEKEAAPDEFRPSRVLGDEASIRGEDRMVLGLMKRICIIALQNPPLMKI